MRFWIDAILDLCILIPAITACIRFSKIHRSYLPFIIFIWVGTIVEISSIALVLLGYSNAILDNIYILVESIIIAWQFRRWNLFGKKIIVFYWIIIIFIITWGLEVFVFSKVTLLCSYFRILYSFVIVIMSIGIINEVIVTERKNLLKNPAFLICISFIFYYTLQVVVEAFWLGGVSINFRNKVYDIAIAINFITNLLYTVAIIWIPTKLKFTLRSS